jgi:hypothetical protein
MRPAIFNVEPVDPWSSLKAVKGIYEEPKL